MSPQMLSKMVLEARRSRKISLRELGVATQLDSSFLSLLERGRRNAEPAVLIRIAQALGLDPLEVLRLAFLERVPESLRSTVINEEVDLGVSFEYSAARRLQRRHYPYEIDSAHIAIRIDWEGNAVITRTYENVRPLRSDRFRLHVTHLSR